MKKQKLKGWEKCGLPSIPWLRLGLVFLMAMAFVILQYHANKSLQSPVTSNWEILDGTSFVKPGGSCWISETSRMDTLQPQSVGLLWNPLNCAVFLAKIQKGQTQPHLDQLCAQHMTQMEHLSSKRGHLMDVTFNFYFLLVYPPRSKF